MKLKIKFLRTRVATRVFTLFIICALVPIVGLSILSFSLVKRQLNKQCLERLHQENKAMAVSIYERLLLVRAEMNMIASDLMVHPEKAIQNLSEVLTKESRERLVNVTLMTDRRGTTLFPLGQIENPPDLSAAEMQHLKSDKALLHQQLTPHSLPRLFIGVLVDQNNPNRGVLLGEINRVQFWQVADRREAMAEFLVMDGQNNILYSSFSKPVSFPPPSLRKMNSKHSGQLEWVNNTKRYVSDYTSLFLKPNFFCPRWIVVLSESRDEALSPMVSFKRWFPFIIILSLGIVFFLSLIHI